MSADHIPHVVDDQESPFWSIQCSCGWRSGVGIDLDGIVELYGQHMANITSKSPETEEP